MKQHQMTHKFRDSCNEMKPEARSPGLLPGHMSHVPGGHVSHVPGTPDSKQDVHSSPYTSPQSSDPLSPPYGHTGVKRPVEDSNGHVGLVDRPAEKRAILCG